MFGQVGVAQPFYSYHLSTLTQSSPELGKTFRNQLLTLTTDLEGSSEVGGLFLHPEMRAGGWGSLLARSRYLFMKMHRARFGDRTLAELRGVMDEAGNAPFWDALAGRFFGMSFPEADEFNAVHGTQFIADLMPRTPIYVALLTDAAQGGDGPAAPERPRGAADARGGRLLLRPLRRHFRRRTDGDRATPTTSAPSRESTQRDGVPRSARAGRSRCSSRPGGSRTSAAAVRASKSCRRRASASTPKPPSCSRSGSATRCVMVAR